MDTAADNLDESTSLNMSTISNLGVEFPPNDQ
jgi:hypothetical protein